MATRDVSIDRARASVGGKIKTAAALIRSWNIGDAAKCLRGLNVVDAKETKEVRREDKGKRRTDRSTLDISASQKKTI